MEKTEKRCKLYGRLALGIAIFNAMFYFSMRSMWSGVRAMLGSKAMPVILQIVLLGAVGFAAIALKTKKARLAALIVAGVFLGVLGYMFSLAAGAATFIFYEFFRLSLLLALLAGTALLIWRYPLKGRQLRAVKAAAIAVVCLISFCGAYGIGIGGFVEGPAVFAVGDRYQIVFTTRADSTAWVEVNGLRYSDIYNGSARSETTVHKIEVPMATLDAAGCYTIGARTMIMRGPYDGLEGRTFTQEYGFRPVDESDGLQFYAISDSHDYVKKSAATASYYGDQLDFLILGGDMASFINSEADLCRALALANRVTGGSRPVIYMRGNHEVKGNRADELDRYVGADGENFYYTVRLGSLWAVVLDMGEDHEDDWWEFYGTAYFAEYRADQTEFLREINRNAASEYAAEGVSTRLALCHIPIGYGKADEFNENIKRDWTAQLNQMGLDLMLSGHTHRIFWTTPDMAPGSDLALFGSNSAIGQVGALNYPVFICSTQTDSQETGGSVHTGSAHTGLAVSVRGQRMELAYTNSKGEIIELHDAFTGAALAQPIVLELAREDGRPRT